MRPHLEFGDPIQELLQLHLHVELLNSSVIIWVFVPEVGLFTQSGTTVDLIMVSAKQLLSQLSKRDGKLNGTFFTHSCSRRSGDKNFGLGCYYCIFHSNSW